VSSKGQTSSSLVASTMIYLHTLNSSQKQITDQMSKLINDDSSIDEKL
jgi:hypothetical protein